MIQNEYMNMPRKQGYRSIFRIDLIYGPYEGEILFRKEKQYV